MLLLCCVKIRELLGLAQTPSYKSSRFFSLKHKLLAVSPLVRNCPISYYLDLFTLRLLFKGYFMDAMRAPMTGLNPSVPAVHRLSLPIKVIPAIILSISL